VLPEGTEVRPISDRGIGVTKTFEGWVGELYEDPAGYCTIGYGHLIEKASCSESMPYQDGINEEEGERLLRGDMAHAERAVTYYVDIELSHAQYSALCDFVFNVGAGAFRDSTLLREINEDNFDVVPSELKRWRKAGGRELEGLIRRRAAEIDVWFEGDVPRLTPLFDRDESPIDILVGETT